MKLSAIAKCILIAAFFSAVAWAADEPDNLPAAAQSIAAAANNEIARVRANTVRQLEALMVVTTKSGDLKRALAIQEFIKQFKDDAASGASFWGIRLFALSSPEYTNAMSQAKELQDMPQGVTIRRGWRPDSAVPLRWSPGLGCRALILITRDKGAGDDSWQRVDITVNGKTVRFAQIDQEKAIVITTNAGQKIDELTFTYAGKKNDPWIEKAFIIP